MATRLYHKSQVAWVLSETLHLRCRREHSSLSGRAEERRVEMVLLPLRVPLQHLLDFGVRPMSHSFFRR